MKMPSPDSPAGKNLRRSQDAGEALRLFTARHRGVAPDDVLYADLAGDESLLVEMLTALRHWADHHATDYAKADRLARSNFTQQTREQCPPGEPGTTEKER